MGAAESTPRIAANADAPRRGYHVARVAEGSPAHLAGIEPFFDYLVGLEGQALDPSISLNPAGTGPQGTAVVTPEQQARIEAAGLDVWRSLEKREGTSVILNVWNSKRQEFREVPVIPSRQWSTPSNGNASASSQPKASAQPSLLGLSLRLCDPSQALSAVWHILDILEGSPAALAGLVPYGDYVIGWAGAGGRDRASAGGAGADDAVPPLRGEGDFYELVERYTNRPLRLYVYNSDFDHTREVIIIPNRDWGGEGLLGCGVGYGLLHRIPRPQERIAPSVLAGNNVPTSPPSTQPPTTSANSSQAGPSTNNATKSNNAVRDSMAQGPSAGGVNDVLVEEDEEEEEEEDGDGAADVTVSVRPDEDE
ncbi:hypothetical protein CF327_g754 [Tilletia walkeri]|nr:hypothetical protein CF327_g754 [Tilletia walkeri]